MVNTILPLCRIRLRLLWNTITSKAGIGKIIGMSLAAILMIISIAAASTDLIEAVTKLPFAELITEWALGLFFIYALFVVFTGDLVSGHTLNTGQMSSDFNYLSTLPISPITLLFVKLFEKLITDYFGILFLLPGLIGISCHSSFTTNGVLVALLLYIEAGLITGLLINLVLVALSRFFKQSTINNFFSIFGYISAILTLIPFLVLYDFNPLYMPKVIDYLDSAFNIFGNLLNPIRWVGRPLMLATPFCKEFGYLSILWAIAFSLLTILFYHAIKYNWFNYAHSRKAIQAEKASKTLFTGLFRKELLMLKSDFNLLINAVFMPISIIVIEIYFMKNVFSFTSMHTIMNFICGSIIYFSMFGPINIIGYEGKAIELLESLPISPGTLIKKKFAFWDILALIIFVPATITTFLVLGFDFTVTFTATLQTIFFTTCCVWIAVCMSAIFAKFDTSVLQQRSTFVGKMAAMASMSILLSVKDISWNSCIQVLIFALIASLAYIKAKSCLYYRQDKEALLSDSQKFINGSLLFLSFIAIESGIQNLFRSVSPDSDTGIWAWCLALAAMFSFFLLAKSKEAAIFPKASFKDIAKSVCISAISFVLAYGYFKIFPEISNRTFDDTNQIINFFSIISIIKPAWKMVMLFLGTVFMTSAVKRANEFIIGKKATTLTAIYGLLLIIMVSQHHLIPATSIFAIILLISTSDKDRTKVSAYSSALFYISLFSFLILAR